jgi:5-methylcytosine-specific restriction endonuclease McrA
VEAEILRHLARVDEQRLWADAAYSSLAAYCMGHLGYSEQMAYKRIRVARLSREIPEILDAIAAGRATVCGLCAVASYVTAQNAAEWIAKIAGKTKRAIEELAAVARVEAGRPAPAPRPMIRALPTPAPKPAPTLPTHSPRPSPQPTPPPANHGSRPAPPAATEVLHRLAVTVTTAVRAKLDRAVALLKHAVPSGDLGAVIERALDALIAATEKRRFGAGSARRAAKSKARTRRIPASVRREVFERDGGACAYVDPEGRRCGCAQGVELHHVVPFARGGANTAENLRMYCRAHNQRQGERDFGPRAR